MKVVMSEAGPSEERKEESGTKEKKIVYLPAQEVEEEEGGEWADTVPKIGHYRKMGDGCWKLVSKTHPDVRELPSDHVEYLVEIEGMFADDMEGQSHSSASGSRFVSIVQN